jgi:hypothetical protein
VSAVDIARPNPPVAHVRFRDRVYEITCSLEGNEPDGSGDRCEVRCAVDGVVLWSERCADEAAAEAMITDDQLDVLGAEISAMQVRRPDVRGAVVPGALTASLALLVLPAAGWPTLPVLALFIAAMVVTVALGAQLQPPVEDPDAI